MKKTIFIFIIIIISSSLSHAVKLKPTPIQDNLKANIMLASNEFDDFKSDQSDKNIAARNNNTQKSKDLSMGKAVLYSALLPGLGEYYTGHKSKAKYFFTAEALTWVGYISFRTYASWKEDDMIRYAAQYANAQLDGKDDAFHDLVGFYNDIEQYNTIGRVSDPDRPYLLDIPENHWYWQSDAHRQAYRVLKNRAREADRRTEFMIGAAIVNRIISIIDTVRDVKRSKRRIGNDGFSQSQQPKYKIDINPLSQNSQVKITFYPNF